MPHQQDLLSPLSQNILSRIAKKLAFMIPVTHSFVIVPKSYGLDISPSSHEDFVPVMAHGDLHLGETSFAGFAASLPKEALDKTFILSIFPNGNYELQEVKKSVLRQLSTTKKVSVAVTVLPLPLFRVAAYGIVIHAVGMSVSDYNCSLAGTVVYDPDKDSLRSIEDNLILKAVPANLHPSSVVRGSDKLKTQPEPLNRASDLAHYQASFYFKE